MSGVEFLGPQGCFPEIQTRSFLVGGCFKRGLEYGVRAPVFYGNLREKTVFREFVREACCVLTENSENLLQPYGQCNSIV